MHNSSHHIQSKRQSAPIKKTLFTHHRTVIPSLPLITQSPPLVIPSLPLVTQSLPLAILSAPLVMLSEAKHLPAIIPILLEVSAGDTLRTRLRFEQRLSRND